VSGTTALALMAVVCVIAAIVVYAAMRASSRAGAAEAEKDAAEGQVKAIKADQERADAIKDSADQARRKPAGDKTLAERLQSSGRGRKTRP
jgi:hypothetical protein